LRTYITSKSHPDGVAKKLITSRRISLLFAASAALFVTIAARASTSTQVEELGPLAVPRTAHTATALSDGRVLIVGGRDSAGTVLAAAEIFNPATQTSTAIGALLVARTGHTATLLRNGRVLIAGGTNATGPLASVEIFDPAALESGFRLVAAHMGTARTRHTATLLSGGNVLIAGGDDAGTAEIFDPATETFSSALLAMAAPRIGHTATLFSDNSVLLAGGNTNSMELFTSTDQTFTLDAQVMSAVRTGQEAIALSDTRLLFFGGDTASTIEEFNPIADTIMVKGTMDAPASSATLLANGKILVLRADMAGLYAPDAADASSAFSAFDETSVPGSSTLRRSGQTATELSGDKRILVAGGSNAQNHPVAPVAVFNPARIWTDKDDYQPGDSVVLSGSGWKANENIYLFAVDSQTEAWTYESTIQADANGAFVVNPYFIVQLVQDGANFSVTAMGAQSAMQADVKFTDSTFNSLSLTPTTQTTTAGIAATKTYTVTAGFSNSPGSNTVTFSLTWNAGSAPTGVTTPNPAFAPPSVTQPGGSGSLPSTLTINTSAGTPAGSYGFTVTGTPTSGNARQATGTLVVGQAPAFTSATSTTFTVNSAGTFTVTATGVPAPTFSFTGSLPSGVTLNSTTGVLSGTPAFGTAGTYPITITAQNGVTPNATQNFTLTVDKILPTFSSLTASQTIPFGRATINVSGRLNAGSNVVPTGMATISVANAPTATSSNFNGNLGNFNATINTSAIPASASAYTITYSYAGDANFKSATDTSTTLTVNKASTTTAITSDSPDPSTDVQSVTVNYQVSVTAPGGGTPTGNVHVSDGVDSCDGSVAAGTCSLTLTTVGARTLTATYAGDSNFNGSPSAGEPHTVNASAVDTSTMVTSLSNPSTYGDNVTFTAKVAAASGTNNPTGSVTFTIDGTPGSPVSLGACTPAVAGTACASTSTSTLSHTGSPHSVSASYTPGTGFNSSNGSLAGGQAVNAKALTVTGITANNKQYNGDDVATLDTSSYVLHTPVSGDDVSLDASSYSAHFNNKTVADDKPVTVTGLGLTGAAAGNYTLTQPTGMTANITHKALTVSGITVNTRDYNGTDAATLNTSSAALHDPVDGDVVSLDDSSYSAHFDNRNAGTTKPVTVSGLKLSGGDAGNYTLTQPTGLTGQIKPLAIDVTAVTDTKTYDGGTASTGTPTISPALFSPDTSGFTQAFNNRNAGVGNKTLVPSGSVNDGNDGNNYAVTFHNFTTGTINQRSITVTAQTNTKIYDGDTSAAAIPQITGGSLAPIGSDTANFTESYDNANHGTGKTLTPSGSVSDGNSGLNYDVHFVNNTTGVINPAHTSTGVTSSLNPSKYGQSVSFTATVSNTDTSPVPTGSVQFQIDGVDFGAPVALSSGSGTSGATTTLAVPGSPHSVAAVYTSADGNFVNSNGSLSGGQTVNQATSTTTITSDTPDPSIVGQSYQVHWTVTPQYTGTPTGTVNVSDGTDSCSAAVSAGFCTLTSTTVGAKTLTATYSGDDNFITSSNTTPHGVQYQFIGFLQPIDNLPMCNSSKAGQTIPVKWQLKDYAGNIIGDLSTLAATNGLVSVKILCDTHDPVDTIEELAAPGSTVFRFDGTQFIFNWQTSKSWAGSCRLMTVTLKDGTKHSAQFTFK
jgi:hypothetical protein